METKINNHLKAEQYQKDRKIYEKISKRGYLSKDEFHKLPKGVQDLIRTSSENSSKAPLPMGRVQSSATPKGIQQTSKISLVKQPTASTQKSFKDILKKNSIKGVGKIACTAMLIYEGYKAYDQILSHPENAIKFMKGVRDIKNMTPKEKSQLAQYAKETVTQQLQDTYHAGKEICIKGVDIAKDLYNLTPETRQKLLKDIYNTGKTVGVQKIQELTNTFSQMKESVVTLCNLPQEDRKQLLSELGNNIKDNTILKGKQWITGALKIWNHLSGR